VSNQNTCVRSLYFYYVVIYYVVIICQLYNDIANINTIPDVLSPRSNPKCFPEHLGR
jgi:hypothetical protein